jgi:polyvinyl alcohol dehydrogenase (cytochrome)
MKTGAVRWAQPVDGPDAWNAACLSPNPAVNDNCPKVEGPDFDFGQAPVLVSPCRKGLGCRQLLVVGQKSGLVWAVDPADGRVVWKTRAGPGGIIGGHMWGSASDNNYVYGNNNNYGHVALDLAGADAYLKPVPNAPGAAAPPATANGGHLTALDAWDGSIKWTFTNPAKDNAGKDAWSLAPVTVANGVVLYASADTKGTLFALNAADGKLLGSYELGASSACGPAVVDGVVYSGTGYSNFALGVPGTKVIALQVPK